MGGGGRLKLPPNLFDGGFVGAVVRQKNQVLRVRHGGPPLGREMAEESAAADTLAFALGRLFCREITLNRHYRRRRRGCPANKRQFGLHLIMQQPKLASQWHRRPPL